MDESPLVLNIGGIFWWTDAWLSIGRVGGEWDLIRLLLVLNSDKDLVGDWVRILELSVRTEEAFDDDDVEPVGERGPMVD